MPEKWVEKSLDFHITSQGVCETFNQTFASGNKLN